MADQRDDLTYNTPPWPDGPHWLDHADLLAKVLERDFVDFPTAWSIQAAGLTHTSAECSAVQSRGFLCDCGAVEARWADLRMEALAALRDGGAE